MDEKGLSQACDKVSLHQKVDANLKTSERSPSQSVPSPEHSVNHRWDSQSSWHTCSRKRKRHRNESISLEDAGPLGRSQARHWGQGTGGAPRDQRRSPGGKESPSKKPGGGDSGAGTGPVLGLSHDRPLDASCHHLFPAPGCMWCEQQVLED